MKKLMTKKKNHKKIGNTLSKVLIGILGILVITLAGLVLFNKWEVIIDFNGNDEIHAQYGVPYEPNGITAEYTGSILKFYKKPAKVTVDTSQVNFNQFGEYTISYTATYKDKSTTVQKKLIVEDTIGPDIQLTSTPDAYTVYNHSYEEEGFKAIDNYDGDVTDKVESKEVNGMVYYTVTDSNGNTSTARRKITYDDRKGPVITLNGGDELNTFNGQEYKDDYTAIDDCDGDITSKVQVEGTVDTNTNGDYELKYTVTDEHGNTSTATRKVHVIDKPVNNDGTVEGPKVIYLTFDDGPYKYTDQLLDILDKYNVKATFFTTSAYPNYAYCIAEEAKRGHTVAVHTASHNYAQIYSSASAYWADFDKQNAVIEQQTGSKTNLFRFPGGSSNTVSRNYCSGVVSQIASDAKAKGYVYFDWNVSSGDAGETTDTNVVFNNVTSQVAANSKYGKPSVVLQHDIKEFSVNAVERIIQWGLENGYSFKALTTDSYTAHHSIGN